MKRLLIFLVLLPHIAFAQTRYHKDFNECWTTIRDNYAYLGQQQIDWNKVKVIYQPRADTVSSTNSFIRLLEDLLNELYNGHSSLNTNLQSSNRLVPSGLDLFAERRGSRYIITDLRRGFGAEQCGLRTGMEVVRFNGKGIDSQLYRFLPRYTKDHTPAMVQYAISMLFAGTHDQPRTITVLENGMEKDYFPDRLAVPAPQGLLEYKLIRPGTGYIRINNSLGDNGLIAAFDAALDSLMNTRSLVIDLTETPGGGNTTVARAIMGRFITARHPYQQHEYDETGFDTRRNWLEYVLPRRTAYKGKVYILAGRWTGSMGEGMAIGFDGMKQVTVIGTPMAGLLGAISGFRLTETGIGFQVPTERLYHADGTPREQFVPRIRTANGEETFREMRKIK
ncbi:MAG: S41 family peptidase [Chitinophagaceae bacterium]